MSKFISVVKFIVKEGQETDFLNSMKKFSNPEGVIYRKILKTGDRSYCSIVEWVNEQSLANARQQMMAWILMRANVQINPHLYFDRCLPHQPGRAQRTSWSGKGVGAFCENLA